MKYHNYIFLTSDKSLKDVSETILAVYKKEFLEELNNEENVVVYTYATLGLKVNTNILIWLQSESIEDMQLFLNLLMHTRLGRHLTITYTLFGMTRPTLYSPQDIQDSSRKGGKYLIIYPFTKTHSWYELDLKTRKKLMTGHMTIGKRYRQVTQLLLYSYGVDDNEFIVSYETDKLPDFQQLVMDLRMDSVRAFTKKDTPIYTCIYKSPEEALDFL